MFPMVEVLETRMLFSGTPAVFALDAVKPAYTLTAGETLAPIRVEALDRRGLVARASGEVTFTLMFSGQLLRTLGTAPLIHGKAKFSGLTLTQGGVYVVTASMPGVSVPAETAISVTGSRPVAMHLGGDAYNGTLVIVTVQLSDQYGNETHDRSLIRLGDSTPSDAGVYIIAREVPTGTPIPGVVVRSGKVVGVRYESGSYTIALATKAAGSGNVTVQLIDSDRRIAPIDVSFQYTFPGPTLTVV